MQQRDLDRRLDLRGHLVHGVRAQYQEVGAGGLHAARGLGEDRPRGLPCTSRLQPFDRLEVHAVEDAFGRVQPAEPVAHRLVDELVVGPGGLPAHPTQQADGLHGSPCPAKARSAASHCAVMMPRARSPFSFVARRGSPVSPVVE